MEETNGVRVKNEEQDRRINWLENHWSTFNTEIGEVKTDLATVKTDVSWLKKYFWIVATASIGGLVAGIINILINR